MYTSLSVLGELFDLFVRPDAITDVKLWVVASAIEIAYCPLFEGADASCRLYRESFSTRV